MGEEAARPHSRTDENRCSILVGLISTDHRTGRCTHIFLDDRLCLFLKYRNMID